MIDHVTQFSHVLGKRVGASRRFMACKRAQATDCIFEVEIESCKLIQTCPIAYCYKIYVKGK